jgi:hypothetical protein
VDDFYGPDFGMVFVDAFFFLFFSPFCASELRHATYLFLSAFIMGKDNKYSKETISSRTTLVGTSSFRAFSLF